MLRPDGVDPQEKTSSEGPKDFSFGTALEFLKQGRSVTRSGWRDRDVSVHLQVPDENSKMTLPYLYMEKPVGEKISRFPLDLSCESILAEDWQIL